MKIDIFNTNKKYNVIYADPPWCFQNWSDKGKKRNVDKHYPTMSKEDIQNLPIKNICEENAILFLWVTSPCLIEGIELIKKWGFTYKTVAFTWIKKNKKTDSLFTGMGYYTRSNAEFCLIATKGKILSRLSHSVHSVIISKIREHSRKPDEARERIVELLGDVPRIELFARQYADGWDCWGNEAPENEEPKQVTLTN